MPRHVIERLHIWIGRFRRFQRHSLRTLDGSVDQTRHYDGVEVVGRFEMKGRIKAENEKLKLKLDTTGIWTARECPFFFLILTTRREVRRCGYCDDRLLSWTSRTPIFCTDRDVGWWAHHRLWICLVAYLIGARKRDATSHWHVLTVRGTVGLELGVFLWQRLIGCDDTA